MVVKLLAYLALVRRVLNNFMTHEAMAEKYEIFSLQVERG
jgi:hypothetical protein